MTDLEMQLAIERKRREKAEAELDELEQTFDLRWQADRRAISRWQGMTGRKNTWPDHADLCVHLLTDLAAAEIERRECIPISSIESQISHIQQNGVNLARFGGDMENEGRCRELCALYLREFIATHRAEQQIAAIDAAIEKERK